MDKIQIRSLLIDLVNFIIPIEKISNNDDLFDFGLDSLDCVKLIASLQKNYGIIIPVELIDLDSFSSVNNIYNLICKVS